MSEYWVSNKKYFCKYCNIYIADDAPSRSHHENGLRHKGNVERFVRGLYKTGEKRKQELEEEKREMARVEQAAQAAFARDVGSGLVKPGSSSSAAAPKPVADKPVKKPSNPYENYSTAASLGYTDLDTARLQAEAERRRTEGVAGDWEVIASEEPAAPSEAGLSSSAQSSDASVGPVGQKRVLDAAPEEEDSSTWKLKRKKMGTGLGETYDPGLIPIKLKAKKEDIEIAADNASVPDAPPSASSAADTGKATALPKWSARGWNKPGANDKEIGPSSESGSATGPSTLPDGHSHDTDAPVEHEPSPDISEQAVISDIAKSLEVKVEDGAVKSEETDTSVAAAPTGMFRKRKMRGGVSAGMRGRT